jgi:protein phosphatase
MRLESFGITDVGLKRSVNEDAFYRADDIGLYLVADGMGGHAAGEVASARAIEAIVDFVHRHLADDTLTWPFSYERSLSVYANALLCGIRLANQQLCAMQQANPELGGMGTTIAALRIADSEGTVAHVGDSRVYRFQDDKLIPLTSDHSWVNEQVQKKLISLDDARNHRYRNVITRALGNRFDVEIDVSTVEVKPGDVFVLTSDGLTGVVEDEVIAETLRTRTSLRECVNHLVDLANMAGGPDNITVVVVECLPD